MNYRSGATLRVLVDIDGTLYDMRPTVCALMNEFYNLNLSIADITDWDFSRSLLDHQQYQHFITYGLHRDATIAAAAPFADAAGVLRSWRKAGAAIHVVTHRAQARRGATRDWLERHGIPFDELVCHPFVDKFHYAASRGLNLVIDDKPALLEQCVRAGISAATIAYPYNQKFLEDFPQILGAASWSEIEERLDLEVLAQARDIAAQSLTL